MKNNEQEKVDFSKLSEAFADKKNGETEPNSTNSQDESSLNQINSKNNEIEKNDENSSKNMQSSFKTNTHEELASTNSSLIDKNSVYKLSSKELKKEEEKLLANLKNPPKHDKLKPILLISAIISALVLSVIAFFCCYYTIVCVIPLCGTLGDLSNITAEKETMIKSFGFSSLMGSVGVVFLFCVIVVLLLLFLYALIDSIILTTRLFKSIKRDDKEIALSYFNRTIVYRIIISAILYLVLALIIIPILKINGLFLIAFISISVGYFISAILYITQLIISRKKFNELSEEEKAEFKEAIKIINSRQRKRAFIKSYNRTQIWKSGKLY